MRVLALIVAAGSSARYGGERPKAYESLNGKPVLRHSMETFLAHPKIDGVRVVISRAHHPLYRKLTDGLMLYPCIMGGRERQDSVRLGLESIACAAPTHVLIHDGARPLVSAALIGRVIDALTDYPAVLPALPVTDTLKRQEADTLSTVDRSGMLAAQTPQGFRYNAILDAHRRFRDEPATDDIALAERAGLAVGVVPGEPLNFKITVPKDLAMMQRLTQTPHETRVGMGFDVHHFVPHAADTPPAQRVVTLCGVKIPHDKKLHGHSDADAGLHALVDALLGAIGEGDIGQHFPPDDPQWAGADSRRFLIHTYQLLTERGGEIFNIDITIIAEKPRIEPQRALMAAEVAGLLKLPVKRVNIKATTTEKLGFLGRGEGLAAQAVVSVRVPAQP